MKRKEKALVLYQCEISKGIYDLWLETDLAKEAHAGQFVGVYPNDRSKLLPRPISICRVYTADVHEDAAGLPFSDRTNALRLVYRVTPGDSGTARISAMQAGDEVSIIGILGNGYDLNAADGKRTVLMGGGIGIPPMLCLAQELAAAGRCAGLTIVLGYRDSNFFLKEDFDALTELGVSVEIATEDGSFGVKGNVLDLMREKDIPCDLICACGPMPMLRAIAAFAKERGAKAYISLEERMACGVGACLGCITKTKETDGHSHVKNARICTDGPVFDADILDLEG